MHFDPALLKKFKLLRTTQATTKREARVLPGYDMVSDTKWASAVGIATLDFVFILMEVQRLLTGLLMASVAEMSAVEADVKGDIAAESALVVDVFVTMLFLMAGELTET